VNDRAEFGGIPSPQSLLLSGRSDFLGVELAYSSSSSQEKTTDMLKRYIPGPGAIASI